MIIKPRYNGPQMPTTYAVNMTAAGSGSNGITVADDDDIDFGTGDFFVSITLSRVTGWQPAALTRLVFKSDGANGYSLNIAGSGAGNFLSFGINGTTYTSSIAPFTVVQANQMVTFAASVVRSSASAAGSVTFYKDGEPFGTAQTISAGVPVTVNNAVPLYLLGTSTTRTSGTITTYISGNFAPTAAEVLDLCTNGIPESWKWGSQAILTSQASSDFEAGTVGSWTANASGATVVVNSTTPIAGTYDLSITSTGSTASGACVAVSIISGKLYSFRFSYKAASGAWTCSIRNTTGATSSVPATGIVQPTITADGSIRTAVYTFTATATQTAYFHVRKSSEASLNTLFLDNFISVKAGATMSLLPNSIPTSGATAWDDSSGKTGGGTLPAAGATKVTIRK